MIGLLLLLSGVQGVLTQDTVWSRSDSPIVVTGDVTVASGVTLTIEAGVEVRFEGNHTLTVHGTLDTRGTPEDEIVWVVNGRRVLELEEPTLVTDRVEPPRSASETRAPILATGLSFDAVTGEIRYTLPEPALVRARIGVRDGGPLLRTLLDWEPRAAGSHVEVWDRRDGSGAVDFGLRHDLMLVLACLPERSEGMVLETVRGRRKAPRFSIALSDAVEDGERVPVRVAISPEDYRWLRAMRFEIALYLDAQIVTEHEQGDNPFDYLLDTSSLDPGAHVLTVNVIAFEGEIGTRSVPLLVQE